MKRAIIFIVTIPLLFCFGCTSKKESGRITITFWHSFVSSTIPALNKLISKFESDHPGISIKAQYIPTGDALIQKLITAVQSKSAPDISWIHSNYLENLVSADAIYTMNEFIDGTNGLTVEEMNDFYPALLQLASWHGTLYSMPMEATNLGLLYNKDHFRQAKLDPEKPPTNWKEFSKTAIKLTLDTDRDGKFDQLGCNIPIFPSSGPLGTWMVWQWMPFLWQAGGYMINIEQTKVLFNSNAGVQALTFWKEIYDALNLKLFTMDYDVAFASGRLSMAFDGPWNLPRYGDLLAKTNWAIAPLPAGPSKQASIVGGEFLAIFKQSQYPQQAWTFIKWILNPEIQAFWSMNSGYLPVRRSVLGIQEYQNYLNQNPALKVYAEQMEFSQAPRPFDFYSIEITTLLAEAIEKATVGNMDPKKVLDEAAEKSNKLLRSVENTKRK